MSISSALVYVLLVTASTVNAFTINIEFKLPKNVSDPTLIDLFNKISNVNATAIAESVDKHIVRIDSLLVLNHTVDLKNKIMVENEAEIIRRLIELTPLVNNLTSIWSTVSTTNRQRTTTTSTRYPSYYDYDSNQYGEAFNNDYSAKSDDSTVSSQFEVHRSRYFIIVNNDLSSLTSIFENL